MYYCMKGGIGKSSLSTISAYQLGLQHKKVLLIDLDAQANSTAIFSRTYETPNPRQSLYKSLLAGDLNPAVCHMTNYVDIAPADWSMSLFNQSIEQKYDKRNRNLVLKQALESVKDNYDYIFLDLPPTISTLVNNAVLASDFVTIVLQTQQSAYDSSIKTASYLNDLRNDYNARFQLTGVILYLLNKVSATDKKIVTSATNFFGKAGIYANPIRQRERVKRWANLGITSKKTDSHDKYTQKMYSMVLKEMLYRSGELEVK